VWPPAGRPRLARALAPLLRDPRERDYRRGPRMDPRNRTSAPSVASRFWSAVAPAERVLGIGLAGLAMGCSAQIGSACTQPTDCSAQGDRVCDTAQPGGYCTILGCLGAAGTSGNACPDNGVCVEFQVAVPGCPYDDYEPARTGLSFCMEHCGSNSDCRSGYECADPRRAPWNGAILENDQSLSVCISSVPAGVGMSSSQDGAVENGVCTKSLPDLPDAFPFPAASSTDGSGMAPVDAAGADAPGD